MLDPAFSAMKAKIEGWSSELEVQWQEMETVSKISVSDHYEGESVGILPSESSDDKGQDAGDNSTMSQSTDYRHELQLRDEQLRREMDLRQESFRAEQAVREKALDDRVSGFLAAQAERDKAWEKVSEARFDRIEKDVASIKSDTKKVSEDVNGMKITMAKYLGGAIVIGAVASAILGAAAKHLFT